MRARPISVRVLVLNDPPGRDVATEDIGAHFAAASEFITAALTAPGANVLVHCFEGGDSAYLLIVHRRTCVSSSSYPVLIVCSQCTPTHNVLPSIAF